RGRRHRILASVRPCLRPPFGSHSAEILLFFVRGTVLDLSNGIPPDRRGCSLPSAGGPWCRSSAPLGRGPMLPRLARRCSVAALVIGVFSAPAGSQTFVAPDPSPIAESAPDLAPLWDTPRVPPHRHASAPLAPFVTISLPEDAAWEGFTGPGPA